MNIIKNYIIVLTAFGVLINAAGVFAATQAQYNAIPPFLSTDVLPNVMFMLDNSGSMKISLAESEFDTGKIYYGMFEGDKNYKYDPSIPLDPDGYNGTPYDVNVLPTFGAFVEDNTCSIGPGNNCWNGSFLNWVVTRRIDAARKVMVGGKVETRTGHDYISGDGGDPEWKIVGNNERSDRVMERISPDSGNYTGFPNSSRFVVTSPAIKGKSLASYDPYAKLKVPPHIITDINGNIIGEYGTVSGCGADPAEKKDKNKWYTVSLYHNYSDPVVVATPLSYNGSEPAVVRISSVTSDSFKVRTEEWEYHNNKKHTAEDIPYLVFERGWHELPGGEKITAGTQDIDSSDTQVDISASSHLAPPVVLSSVITNNDDKTVTTRQRNITSIDFYIKLQEEKAGESHNIETVSYIALDSGDYDDGYTLFQVGIEDDIDDQWGTISFTDTGVDPSFLASMQTTNGPDPASLRYQNLDTDSVEVFVEEEESTGDGMEHADENVGYVVLSPIVPPQDYNIALIVEEEPKGLLHDIEDKVRLGVSFYNYEKDDDIYNGETFHGGTMKLSIPKNPFVKKDSDTGGYREIETPVAADIDVIVDAIEHYPLVWGTTPLAENYYEVIRYFQQKEPYYSDSSVNDTGDSYDIGGPGNEYWDPYWFKDKNGDGVEDDPGLVSCAQSYVLVFTDGAPYKDYYIPGYNSGTDDYSGNVNGGSLDYDGNSTGSETSTTDPNSPKQGGDALDDLALWAKSVVNQSSYETTGDRDLRSDTGLEDNQNLTTYTVGFGSDILKQILVDTANHGGGRAYAAEDGRELKTQLTNAFTDILSRSSGTAASVISNTRSGEGAIYQSVFFPSLKNSNNKVTWVGQLHSLLVDAFGNMREDTNMNDTLDIDDDYFIVFNEDGTAKRYVDGDGNQRLELDIADCPKKPDSTCYDSLVDTIDLDDLNYLWNTSEWLNEITDQNVEDQRFYSLPAKKRYIFTWVDGDSDNKVDSGEVIDFTSSSTTISDTDLTNASKIYPYLHHYPSFGDRPPEITALSPTDLKNFLRVQTNRQINYIRGSDCVDSNDAENCNTQPLQIGGIDIENTDMRPRKFDYDGDGTIETWRLGDIVYSTPTLVGRPSENLHLLYRDSSYAQFAYKYKNRRQVVYAGANDGMVHAFNAGFYNPQTKQFCRSSDFTNCQDLSKPELGAELWAYVPFNLLPHLYWLTQPSYSEAKHVYYIDQKPRIFDAKIFTEEPDCSDPYDEDCIHPDGWGTVMVIGMNLGGGSIIADMDKTDGNSPDTVFTDGDGVDPTMKSAFMIFDITDPEAEPRLLTEVTMPNMGFATSYPTVLTMKDGNHDGTYGNYASGENKWFLAFGSGPADLLGDPGAVDTSTGEYNDEILDDVKSLQPGRFYMLDLVKLASDNQLHTLNNSGNLTAGLNIYSTFDSNTFISTTVSADFNLDYNADVLYFGTISGDSGTGWGGKFRRIVIDNENNSQLWDRNSILMDVGKPISAAPAIGLDSDHKNWVFSGTGRYFTPSDKNDTSQQSFYGLKEPVDGNGDKSWNELVSTDLIDVTNVKVYTDGSVEGSSNSDWESLLTDQSIKDGWILDFSTGTGERNLGQAALTGGLLSFTTFIPESDICTAGGESLFWALYYETGTAHYSGVLGTTTVTVGTETKEMA